MKEKCKDMKQEEKEQYKKQLEENKKKESEKIKLEKKQKRDKEKEEFKKLSKVEKLKLKQEKIKQKIVEEKYIEFPYLEELNDKQIENLKNINWTVIDPGKSTILFMKNKNGEVLRYTNKQYTHEIKRFKYQRLIKNYKDKHNISQIENELSKYNSKSCDYKKYQDYIKNKNRLNKILLDKYKNEIFRKYKWYGYINKQRAQTNLINNIKNKFGNETVLIMGDYSDRNSHNKIKGCISTPNLGLKRKLAEYFIVYNIDEFRTSCLNNKTEERCENIYLPDKKGEIRKIHSILTYQMENKRKGCINRDMNAVNNMIKLVNYFLLNKDRPEKYKRSYKFETINQTLFDNTQTQSVFVKDENPNILASSFIKPVMVQLH